MKVTTQGIKNCNICNASVCEVLELPKLPITGLYSESGQDEEFPYFDQALMLCEVCKHSQLLHVRSPEQVYDKTYAFRSASSKTALAGLGFFLDYLGNLFKNRKFESIVEFGCNDANLLQKLSSSAKKLVGIDPVVKADSTNLEENITLLSSKIEDVNFSEVLGAAPELIISRHTMEHISEPRALMENLFRISDENTIFLFEFPCFDPLLESYRFDQIFHQHLQYYSLESFTFLLNELNAEVIDYTFNYNHWGALLIAFKAGAKQPILLKHSPEKTIESIKERYQIFQKQMGITAEMIVALAGKSLYGYGAALMLPILAYHLGLDLSQLNVILDNDAKKDGLGYINLPVQIKYPANDFSLADKDILLTALDNRRPILKRLSDSNARRIINPLQIM